jgi:ATP-dependent helicase/nuclease subunit A
MVDLDQVTWEEPAGLGIRRTEQAYRDAERRRVVYVAATRARDLLILPKAGNVPPGRFVCGDLLADALERLMRAVETYVDGAEPAWAREVGLLVRQAPGDGADLEREVGERWGSASREAARPRFRPASVSADAPAAPAVEIEEAYPKQREGRYGGLFGMTVHNAIGLVIRDGGITPGEAARRAARWFGLEEHLAEAAADVERALGSLRAVGLARAPGPELQLEYPVAGAWEGGQLLGGYIDLVGVVDGQACVLDFKTDAPPRGPVEQAYPGYAAQVRAYGRLLHIAGHRRVRCGLLFTVDGEIRWVEPPSVDRACDRS